jgi:hypothetical protein
MFELRCGAVVSRTQMLATVEQDPTRPAQRTLAARGEPVTIPDLHLAAAYLGQIDVGDPRWTQLDPVLDACLREAVRRSHEPRASVWRTIADDPESPLVVKLRTFGLVLGTLNRSDPSVGAPAA